MRSFLITSLIFFTFLIGWPYYSYNQSVNQSFITTFKNKYSYSNIDKNCNWSETKTYMSCVEKDFFRKLRKSNQTQRQYLFQLYIKIFEHNHYKHMTDTGRLHSYLDHQKILNHFLATTNQLNIKRNHIDLVGILITYYKRSMVISTFHRNLLKLRDLTDKKQKYLESDPLIQSYSNFVLKDSMRIKNYLNKTD